MFRINQECCSWFQEPSTKVRRGNRSYIPAKSEVSSSGAANIEVRMKLQDALDRVRHLNDEAVIFARKPWALEVDADIGSFDSDLRVPRAIAARGLDYFLEVSVAKEVLEVFGQRAPTADERRALLLYYAEHDAYPRWVYES